MDLSHIAYWVFDLDNTLYPPEMCLFDQIEVLMERFIMREIGIDQTEARQLRDDYWETYGTTLTGLVTRHGIDADAFLAEVHDLDLSALRPDPTLAALIAALPGQRMIYTNGARMHGERVSTARGLRHTFTDVFGTEDAGYLAKPSEEAFRRVFERADIDPTRAVMIEDAARNLEAPKAMGMATVLVGSTKSAFADFHAPDVTTFLESLRGSDGLSEHSHTTHATP